MKNWLVTLSAPLALIISVGCGGSDTGGPGGAGTGSTTSATSSSTGSTSSSSSTGTGTGSSTGSGGAGGGQSFGCVGTTVDSVEACKGPCIYTEFDDGASGPGPFGGMIWCSQSCTSDADCLNPGEICDAKGPTLPHECVRSCSKSPDCAAVGLPDCSALTDGRMACF